MKPAGTYGSWMIATRKPRKSNPVNNQGDGTVIIDTYCNHNIPSSSSSGSRYRILGGDDLDRGDFLSSCTLIPYAQISTPYKGFGNQRKAEVAVKEITHVKGPKGRQRLGENSNQTPQAQPKAVSLSFKPKKGKRLNTQEDPLKIKIKGVIPVKVGSKPTFDLEVAELPEKGPSK
ncbi:hypothetical protein Syun_003625 [Stephania yunnanensis]|uniref:Uncharacterized protein n=1 Tax=Stephania yunnanensis TaxID=152371 RepID=A0AAP0L2Z7_9MAGN